MDLQELQPYIAAGSAVVSVATLGFILRIAQAIRANALDRIAVQEERLQLASDDVARLEKWSEREKSKLREELEEERAKIQQLLSEEGIDAEALSSGKRLSDSAASLSTTIEDLTQKMQTKLAALSSLDGISSELDRETNTQVTRTIAMANMASGRYADAAKTYDTISAKGSASWEDNVSRGIAHANARNGVESDLAALMAYNDAIALMPEHLNSDKRARIFTYRAAMLKRLGRYREAENDLSISLEIASAEYERLDAHYNLACIYALMEKKEKMQEHLLGLKSSKRYRANVASHFHDYFKNYSDDEVFNDIVSL